MIQAPFWVRGMDGLVICALVGANQPTYGRFEGRVGFRVRGHKGTLVFLGYGTHGQ